MFLFAERRPLKPGGQIPVQMYHSPSARLVEQRDTLVVDHAYRGSDGSIMGTLGGLKNKEVHYGFQPSKQIVSIETPIPITANST